MTDLKSTVFTSVQELEAFGLTDLSIAIGVFDGVHIGHQKLLKELLRLSSETSSTPVAITFYPHPRQVLMPDNPPPLLLPPEEKYRRLRQFGVAAVVAIPFDEKFAALSPERFIVECLYSKNIRLQGVCVGKHWRFGAGGSGNTALLEEMSKSHSFHFSPVDEVEIDGETVSSTAIRFAVSKGDLAKASLYLGTPYVIYGKVVHGYGVAGKELNCPTANMDIQYGVLPPRGVYAARLSIEDGKSGLAAVVNVGTAPTFHSYGKQECIRTEVHLLDGTYDLYGKNVVLEPVAFLRAEQYFSSAVNLRKQIERDIQQAMSILKGAGNV